MKYDFHNFAYSNFMNKENKMEIVVLSEFLEFMRVCIGVVNNTIRDSNHTGGWQYQNAFEEASYWTKAMVECDEWDMYDLHGI